MRVSTRRSTPPRATACATCWPSPSWSRRSTWGPIFVTIALPILLSFVLAPGVRLLHRCYLGRVVPVLLRTSLAFLVILGLGGLLVTQLRGLADDLPRYESTILEVPLLMGQFGRSSFPGRERWIGRRPRRMGISGAKRVGAQPRHPSGAPGR